MRRLPGALSRNRGQTSISPKHCVALATISGFETNWSTTWARHSSGATLTPLRLVLFRLVGSDVIGVVEKARANIVGDAIGGRSFSGSVSR